MEFDRKKYKRLCEEMREILKAEKELINRKEEVRKGLIEVGVVERMEYGIKLSERSVSGSVDWKKVCEENLFLGDIDLERYRRGGKQYWDVRVY